MQPQLTFDEVLELAADRGDQGRVRPEVRDRASRVIVLLGCSAKHRLASLALRRERAVQRRRNASPLDIPRLARWTVNLAEHPSFQRHDLASVNDDQCGKRPLV
ncbi:MAG TPA: hypothetical protein VFF43_04595, partial [Caldimonas sp.]|nr:hypothetical protein [Caldimonas sp.]